MNQDLNTFDTAIALLGDKSEDSKDDDELSEN